MLLCAQRRVCHRGDHLHRILSHCRFSREHDSVGAVQDRIGYVKYLRSRRHRITDHRLHHLCGRNDHTVPFSGGGDQIFLDADQLSITDLDPEVSARHHNPIAGINNAVEQVCIGYHFGALNFCDDRRTQALIGQ